MAVKFNSNLSNVLRAFERECGTKLTAAGHAGRGKVLEKLSGPRSGATYPVPGTSRDYTASAPGEAPAQRTGRLRQSYEVSQVTHEAGRQKIEVGSRLAYAVMLERGTSRMAPRPHLEPAMREAESEIRQIFSSDWKLE